MTVTALLLVGKLYLALGAGFAIWFAVRGAGRIDPVAASGTAGFRLLILPGAALLWPYLLARSARARSPRDPGEGR